MLSLIKINISSTGDKLNNEVYKLVERERGSRIILLRVRIVAIQFHGLSSQL